MINLSTFWRVFHELFTGYQRPFHTPFHHLELSLHYALYAVQYFSKTYRCCSDQKLHAYILH